MTGRGQIIKSPRARRGTHCDPPYILTALREHGHGAIWECQEIHHEGGETCRTRWKANLNYNTGHHWHKVWRPWASAGWVHT